MRKYSETYSLSYKLNYEEMSSSSPFEDLGVLFVNKISFVPHLEHMITFMSVGFILRNLNEFTNTALERVQRGFLKNMSYREDEIYPATSANFALFST